MEEETQFLLPGRWTDKALGRPAEKASSSAWHPRDFLALGMPTIEDGVHLPKSGTWTWPAFRRPPMEEGHSFFCLAPSGIAIPEEAIHGTGAPHGLYISWKVSC